MTKIKICGLFRDCDIDYVNEAMPDYAGFVFAKSRRQVTKEQAQNFRKNLKPEIISVGVFVDADIPEIKELFDLNIISMAQLHGNETEDYINELREKCAVKIIKAVNVLKNPDFEKVKNSSADFILFDSGTGSGKQFRWRLLPEMKRDFFLAGGLNLENIDEAVKQVKPFGVDLSSGVETDGFKDKEKILNIVRRIKNV